MKTRRSGSNPEAKEGKPEVAVKENMSSRGNKENSRVTAIQNGRENRKGKEGKPEGKTQKPDRPPAPPPAYQGVVFPTAQEGKHIRKTSENEKTAKPEAIRKERKENRKSP